MRPGGIVMITSGFPRRSETFMLNELLALEARGRLLAIFATKPGDGASPQPGSERLLHRVQMLPDGSSAEQAAAVVERLARTTASGAVAGVHGYFAHRPAKVAALVAGQLGMPYGFSIHARDARKVTPGELADRACAAAGVIACNPDVAHELPAQGARVFVAPHGVDLRRFHPQDRAGHTVRADGEPPRILAVGRLVPKKGFDVLIAAVARLAFPVDVRIIGDGPERERLATLIAAAGLDDRVRLCPGLTHAELPAAYAGADIVAVPSVVDQTGDRDGLPNVLLEAMASARPVVASDAGAISSAITSGDTGLLVPPGDPAALAEALKTLTARPALRRRLGQRGRQRVETEFALEHCTARFLDLIETIYA